MHSGFAARLLNTFSAIADNSPDMHHSIHVGCIAVQDATWLTCVRACMSVAITFEMFAQTSADMYCILHVSDSAKVPVMGPLV